MTAYVAFLRGINVGGRNLIAMSDLKACFEDAGMRDVKTYIQSGNVLFRTAAKSRAALERRLEAAIESRFGYPVTVVVCSREEIRNVLGRESPKWWNGDAAYRHNAIFLKAPLTPAKAIESIETRDGVDLAAAGEHALYFSTLIDQRTKSKLGKIVGTDAYKSMTIRTRGTVEKIAALLAEIDAR